MIICREDSFLFSSCWHKILAAFSDQAQRLSLITGLEPRYSRQLIAQMHGFTGWVGLYKTINALHDISLTISFEMEESGQHRKYRENNSSLLRLLCKYDTNQPLSELENILTSDYGISRNEDEEYFGWEIYQNIKEEFAYRVLWCPGILTQPLSWRSRGLANELAFSLKNIITNDGIQVVSSIVKKPLETVLSIYHGASCSTLQLQDGYFPEYDYDDLDENNTLRKSLCISDETKWISARKLRKQLAFEEAGLMDARTDSFPILALLGHAPHDCYVQLIADAQDQVSLWSNVLFKSKDDIAYAGLFGGGIPTNIYTVTAEAATDDIEISSVAGWTMVEWE